MEDSCVFCKIAGGEIAAKPVYRDDVVLAIEDVNPQAPVHLLVMPVRHHANVGTMCDDDAVLGVRLLEVASRLGRERGEGGFRIVINTGDSGGQTVGHLHLHVLAGRPMTWPPG